MKYIKQLLLFLSIVFFSITVSIAQCNLEQTVIVCDIETIDFDNDTNPDGIVNLYDVTGTTLADGVWSVAPAYDITLDTVTGNVYTWEFFNATESDTLEEYEFQLTTASCGSDPAITVFLQIGPFSGVAAPPGINGANVEICSDFDYNLFETLVSNETTPAPHRNGIWEFIGVVGNPSGATVDFAGGESSVFSGEIAYDPGVPLIDSEIFEFRYVVSGINPCVVEQETIVRISVVRDVDPGDPSPIILCESDIIAGVYDADIDLRDDQYLSGEDIEGIWLADSDTTGQIEDETDSMINIREIYDQFTTNNGSNPRFGCESYEFGYFVQQRSPACFDRSAAIRLTIYEELRPFSQVTSYTVCANEQQGIDLYSLLGFTNQDGFDYIYDNDQFVNWRLVSGDSDLGLIEQPESLNNFDPNIDYHLGTVNTLNATAGTYVFEYAVSPFINCDDNIDLCDPFDTDIGDPNYCDHPCDILSTTVTITVLDFDYAGEDTAGLFLCTSDSNQVDLFTLLTANEPISPDGVWTDQDDNPVVNPFVFPTITGSQDFEFTYTTTSADDCEQSANLSFTLFNPANAGEDGAIVLCTNDRTVTLINELGGTPDLTGTWTGPFGYESTDERGLFIQDNDTLPVLGGQAGIDVNLVYTYTYTVLGNDGCPEADESFVDITFVEPVNIGNNRFGTYCKIDGSVNLFSILDNDTPRNGQFEDSVPPTDSLLPDGTLNFETLSNGIYVFRYVIPDVAPCDEQFLEVSVQIVGVPEPVIVDTQFCILDGTFLEDVVVSKPRVDDDGEFILDDDGNVILEISTNYNWYTSNLQDDIPLTGPEIANTLLSDNQILFIANVDANNCESERVEVIFDILNMGERFSNGTMCTLDFQDGVSPNGDQKYDTFSLERNDEKQEYNIPVAFPNYTIEIYNRYGSIVFQGNKNTGEFIGEGNVSLSLGDDLPSGTYFYIFKPNFENNLPIQGSFYLSR